MPITKKTNCEACGASIPINDPFCPSCGWMRIVYPATISSELREREEKRLQIWKQMLEAGKPAENTQPEPQPENLSGPGPESQPNPEPLDSGACPPDGVSEDGLPSLTPADESQLSVMDDFWGHRDGNNDRTGIGVQNQEDGATYAGQWNLDMKDGLGMQCGPNGESYAGQWRMNLPHGVGVEAQSDGVFSGKWINGRKSGLGTIYFANGQSLTAVFDGDRIVGGVGTWTLRDGTTVAGKMTELGPDGICHHTLSDGQVVAEKWAFGQLINDNN